MDLNKNKLSTLISSQLPEFIRDDLNYETFVAFMESYYEWMELADTSNTISTIATSSNQGVTTGTKNLQEYFDVDESIDDFVAYFTRDFLPYFPEDALSDKRKVLKLARQLYQNKGTLGSYKLLFRLLYNSEVETLLTGDLVFKASASQWYIPKLLKIKSEDPNWLIPEIQNYRIFGEHSKSFATIERVFKNVTKFDVYISNIEREFISGEQCRIVDARNQDVYVLGGNIVPVGTVGSTIISGKLVGSITNITINPKNRGATYNVGDPVVVYGGLSSPTGLGATAVVGETTLGSIQRVYTTNGGYGYRTGPTDQNANTKISFIGGGASINIAPAIAHVQTFDTNVAHVSQLPIDKIALKQHILLSNANYYFANMASANIQTTLLDAFSFTSFDTYPISSVVVDNGGGGYSSVPLVEATSTFYDELGDPQDLGELGILAPMEIIDGGLDYLVGDYIEINGGWGFGAAAQVTDVDINGSITGIVYVDYNLAYPGQVYPKGGMGYTIGDTTGDSIVPLYFEIYSDFLLNPSTGSGAELYVPGILGRGAEFNTAPNRIGSITSIKVTNPGEDYDSIPGVSLRVQDLAVNGISDISMFMNNLNTLLFQGTDIDLPGDKLDIDYTSYQSYLHSMEVLVGAIDQVDVIYNARVYNYTFNPVFGTMIQLDTEIDPYATMNLTSQLDGTLGYVNGVKTYGDGNAKASAKFLNGLIYGQGQYLDTVGHPSGYSVLESIDYNNYTYELSVTEPIAKYRDILKNMLHPAGMKIRGRELLNSQKAFSVGHQSTLANNFTLAHYDLDASVTILADWDNPANNIVTFNNITQPTLELAVKSGQRFYVERSEGPNVYAKIVSTDYANSQITLYTSAFLTYGNVAYGFANASTNVINITSVTDTYGRFVNNGQWSSNAAISNHIVDIIYAGDLLLMNNITYSVDSVSYGTYANTTTITLANNVVLDTGTEISPLLLSINRNIIDNQNVSIYTIN